MDYMKTQLGTMLEQVKMAMLAHTPVVYIPTDQVEVVQQLLYGEESVDSIIPRLCYKLADKSIGRLMPGEMGTTDDRGLFSSIEDNIKVGVVDPDSLRIPSVIVSYVSDWNGIASNVRSFIASYMGVKKSKNQESPQHVDIVHRSLYIVVTPREVSIPAEIAPYVKTVRVPALSDAEIESLIKSHLDRERVPENVVSEQLLSQMMISFRGFSGYRIEQMMNQMIAQQSIDYTGVDAAAIMETIRTSKKQMLENSQGLKWEKKVVSGVAGLDSISQWLNARKEIFRDPERAVRQHIDIPKGLLVSGIPGSGKSLMAKTAATILDMPLISLDMGALLGGIMGESEHNMIHALEMAEQMAPCVLWIDEIEKAFSGSSQGSSNSDGGVGRRMFGKFLTWMQEKSAACFVFATSNDITSLPPELFRSERFDRKFFTFMPMAEECAQIFAANIKAQNRSYQKELEAMPPRLKVMQAQQLFSTRLEEPAFWLNLLNECCCPASAPTRLVLEEDKNKQEGQEQKAETQEKKERYVWSGMSRPKNKLMTGADISALIREAKFCIHPSPIVANVPTVIYGDVQMGNAVRSIMQGQAFKPYGETNLKDIVKCFLKLHENEFVPASGKCILDFDRFDDDEYLYRHDPLTDQRWTNRYDQVLYYTIVGAINHYTTELRKR